MSEEKQTAEQVEAKRTRRSDRTGRTSRFTRAKMKKRQVRKKPFSTKLMNCRVCLMKKKTSFCVFKQTLKTINDATP
ncbi:hypothetical protein QNN00_11885 [Bacillus velezensis]|nr:hypothetical protein [Bacillus velezensis]